MNRYAVAAILIGVFVAPALAQTATVKIINQSKWQIHNLFLSPSAQDLWGPDQLEDGILATGDSITLTALPCDSYDVRVVDEDADECTVEAVEMCGDNSYWKITDENLLACEGDQ